MQRVEADDFDYLGYDELYDLYDLEDEIEATEPKDDLEDNMNSFLSTEMKTGGMPYQNMQTNDVEHEKIQEAESLMEMMQTGGNGKMERN